MMEYQTSMTRGQPDDEAIKMLKYYEKFGNIERYKFCPHCGAPMTDEAVQMVMERMEALKDGKSD